MVVSSSNNGVHSGILLERAPDDFFIQKMEILSKAIYRGPHVNSRTPMIRIVLDLGTLEFWPTDKISGFTESLIKIVPSLQQHGCSYGTDGGFIRRMKEGTWLGHVIEHVALELQSLAGIAVSRGKTRSVKGKPGQYNVMFAYETEGAGLSAGRYAIELVNSLLPEGLAGISGIERLHCEGQNPFASVEEAVKDLRAISIRERPGPTTRSIVEAARRKNIPIMRLDDNSLVQLGWGKYQRRICASITDRTSQIAVDIASDKDLTKKMLASAGIPVPEGEIVATPEDAVSVAECIGYPVVLKPLDGNHGRGVTTNIRNQEQVRAAFPLAAKHNSKVIVEQYCEGEDYRVLVIGGHVVAVSERVPAHIIADGKHNIEELVELTNSHPHRGDGHANVLSRIVIDQHVEDMLVQAGLTTRDIPPANQKILLRCTANLSTGGTAIDRTDEMHPSNIALMERAARTVGLDIAGIDLIAKDITRPLEQSSGAVVEINAAPGFRMHTHPTEGQPRPVGEAVVSMMFPNDVPSRIPVVAITGTNGKSTTTRMITNILRQDGSNVGFTSTSGVYINDDTLWEGDASGPQSARMLLRDSSIDYAVLETARGGIVREGLAFDYCDVGAVLNVTEDHLGIGGIETLEDLAAVKAVVVESVGKNGLSVLNADDPLTRDMAEIAGGKVCFFSMNGGHLMNDGLRSHIENGGMAVVHENWIGQEELVIHMDKQRVPLMPVSKIASAHAGIADFNIQNALAAAAVSLGLGIDIKLLRSGLASFVSSFDVNPGRLNIHDDHGFRVILDYAHNPAALTALIKVVDQMRGSYNNVIGTVSTPGDRRDEDIREMGRIAASGFDLLVFREAPDRRGREPGVVNALLKEGAISAGFAPEDIICVDFEEEAHDICLSRAKPGDLVVLMPTDVKGTWERMLAFKPRHMNAGTKSEMVAHA